MSDRAHSGGLDRLIAEHRAALDAEIAGSGALLRVREGVLMRAPGDPLDGLQWRRVAAAVLVAGMLGGAVDYLRPESVAEPVGVAAVDVLYDLDWPEPR